MNDQLSKIDHLAIIVENIEESVEYYSTKFNCEVKHKDATWAMLKFDNINYHILLLIAEKSIYFKKLIWLINNG